jgi:hypothetical protein
MEDDELYEDLDTDRKLLRSNGRPEDKGLISPESKIGGAACTAIFGAASRRTDSACAVRPKSMVDELKDLEERVGTLENENRLLKRNMGTLYRTSVAELQRKDDQIQELQRELSNHRVRVDATRLLESSPG